eukprot:scaffold279276_cov39-Tisochrysis_lutea.AAC.1
MRVWIVPESRVYPLFTGPFTRLCASSSPNVFMAALSFGPCAFAYSPCPIACLVSVFVSSTQLKSPPNRASCSVPIAYRAGL